MISKILPTWGTGKVFLKYFGKNIDLAQLKIKRHKTRFFTITNQGKTQNLMFRFILHNNIEIAVSLTSKAVYIFGHDWKVAEDSACDFTEVLIDDEFTLIKGILNFTNRINENNRYIEPYTFDFVLRTNPILIGKLEKENIFITDFTTREN